MSNLQIEEKLFNIQNSISKLSLAVKTIFSVEEASAFLNLKPSYLYKLTSDKRIRFYKPNGKLLYFKKEDLESFLLRNPSETIKEEDSIPQNHWKK
ncbi:helix-turn-helix domain-containing protein [Flavobacterium sp. LB2P53]|uniref:helix-turn-helix domain-containing protein n=1 Tax=Flavobacterium sp. LB2P53 TaxID=2497481 RepID=UPI000F837D7F|nr:helix-turn-helix domain-containing protein [Flavobacterium sp. LB2P53]RTY67687.1 DNA-binding protein [Flavobacterium sp. LB2P53]